MEKNELWTKVAYKTLWKLALIIGGAKIVEIVFGEGSQFIFLLIVVLYLSVTYFRLNKKIKENTHKQLIDMCDIPKGKFEK